MQLEKIISLSNNKTRLRLLAMIRSLRTVGCNLPVWVIPYDDDRFELPANCIWWEDKNLIEWLNMHHTRKVMRKYQCLFERNYQFVDSDIIFLRNPETVLRSHTGFITSCGHWHNTEHTTTREVEIFFDKTTTVWQQKVFNSGQFACDEILYDFYTLKKVAEQATFKPTCIDFKFHEQPGLNLLVNLSSISITNITLQPYYMESTWAGDYKDDDFMRFWKIEERNPYIIHWAGCNMNVSRPIDKLFLNYLTSKELAEWKKKVAILEAAQKSFSNTMKKYLKKIKAANLKASYT